MEEKIAIVIPAYKCRFLRQTLDSIVVQTCRSFTVYIGDDASPQNLKALDKRTCGRIEVGGLVESAQILILLLLWLLLLLFTC